MREIHQLVHTLSYGDAISTEVLSLQRCFQNMGHRSEVYAINVHPLLKGKALPYQEFPRNFEGEIILHFSLGSPLNQLYASLENATRSIIYHNLTPARWFEGVNPRIVRDIESGARDLAEMCRISDRLIADSQFNADELKAIGFPAQVLELPVDEKKWDMPANEGIAQMIKGDLALHMVHVGRIAPNKCIEDIIKTFYFLHHYVEKYSKLWLVGIDTDTELYSFSLKRLVDEFDLTQSVQFVGCLADSELKALYQNASVYLCMSEHEGFCLPVVEAMYFGLPVIAYASTALPGTMGNGGILVKEKRHPEIAELAYKVARDPKLREELVQAGHKRVADLGIAHFADAVSSIFQSEPRMLRASA